MHSPHRGAGGFYFLCAAWLLFGIAAFAPNAGAQPANDMFGSATNIIGNSGSLTATNVGATKEAGEPDHAGNLGGASVWWVWTAPASGSVTFDTNGTALDTVMGVYQGSAVNQLTAIAEDDDSGVNYASSVTFSAVSGGVYYIGVAGYGRNSFGPFNLNWAQ